MSDIDAGAYAIRPYELFDEMRHSLITETHRLPTRESVRFCYFYSIKNGFC